MSYFAKLVSSVADVAVKLTGIRRDWALHAMAGVPVALYGAGLGLLALRAQINMVATCTLVAGLTFAVTKEIADWMCNVDAVARGEKPPHGVEAMDALFSVLASVIIAAAVQMKWF